MHTSEGKGHEMSVDIDATAPSTARTDIRRHAMGLAVMVGCICLIFRFVYSGNAVLAVSSGIAAAFAGLVAWTVYHRISRRSDGLCIVMVPMAIFLPPSRREGLIEVVDGFIIVLIIAVPLSYFFGTYMNLRDSSQGETGPYPADPLFDSELNS
jgi:drug/metabolite transporter (DMT)-like permease